MSKMKKTIKFCSEITFVLSLTLLGKYDINSMQAKSYRTIMLIFWVSGILNFIESKDELKDEVVDSLKDLIIAITVIPLWYMIGKNLEFEIETLLEMLFVICHYFILFGVVLITNRSMKSVGSISYFSNLIIPVIFIIFLMMDVPIIVALLISVILLKLIYHRYFLKNKKYR